MPLTSPAHISSGLNGRTLFPYQQEGVELLVERPRALLADPPGAGKTAQAIVAADRVEAKWILVVCPASLRLNWAKEFRLWSDRRRMLHVVLSGQGDKCRVMNAAGKVTITSYELAVSAADTLAGFDWDLVIFDEAHFLKGQKSQRSKVCREKLAPTARRIIAITGTPLPNGRAVEAWPVFSMLDPEEFGHFWRFVKTYTYPEETPWGTKYDRSKNLKQLGALARERFMIRRTKQETLGQLPPLQRQTVPLVVPEVLDGLAFLSEAEELVTSGEVLPGPIATARRELGEAKVRAACDFIRTMLESEEQVVVFFHHRSVGLALRAALDQASVTFVSIVGETPPEARQSAVDAFQGGKARVFLGSIGAAGTGITLTASSVVVMVEASWVPSENEQCEARCYRVSQSELTRVFYLVVPDSLDDAITNTVIAKQRNIERVLGES